MLNRSHRPVRTFRRLAATLTLALGALLLSPQADAHHWHGGWGWGWGCCGGGWGWGGWWGPSYSVSFGWPYYYGYPSYAYSYYAAPYYPPYTYAPTYSYAPAYSYPPSYSWAPSGGYGQRTQQSVASNAPTMQTWYYCENPRGYYPQVKSCSGGWHQVLVQPSTTTGQAR
jgi:hypothetical protein